MSKSLSKNHHETTQNWCFVDAVSLSPPFRHHPLATWCEFIPNSSSTSIEIEQLFHFLAGIGDAKVNQKFDTKWCRWCKIAFIDGKFLPDFHTNQSRHRSQPPSRHRQVLHPRIPRWLGPNLIQLAEIWIFGGNMFFWQKNEDLTSSTSFLGEKQEFMGKKKHGNLLFRLLQSDQNSIPKRRSLCFSPEKVTKMGTETRSLWRYLGMRVALPQ